MMDMHKVANLAVDECIRQGVGLDRVGMLLNAYDYAHFLRNKAEMRYPTLNVIMTLAGIAEPTNESRFRNIPVRFANGGTSAKPAQVQELMVKLFDLLDANGTIGENAFVKEFLWIHPFTDGNGRTAWILLNWLWDSLDNPIPLPDFGW